MNYGIRPIGYLSFHIPP